MGDDAKVQVSQSYHTSIPAKQAHGDTFSKIKSDVNCSVSCISSSAPWSSPDSSSEGTRTTTGCSRLLDSGEYYKKYEHDELPVKDSDDAFANERANNKSLTNSDLDSLERRIFQNVSQELQTDDSSLTSLESNIKFFKNTVEKIFDNFYSCMSDFEHYKRRFHEILNKSKEGSVDDMEEFIKDMFEHIMSSENSLTKGCRHSDTISDVDNAKICISSCGDSAAQDTSSTEFLEAFKNENYQTDSTDGNSTQTKKISDIEEKFNIFFLSGTPRLEINLIGRNMLSEFNLKEAKSQITTDSIASADNLRKVAAKKMALEKHMKHEYEASALGASDRDIPVKVSFAKKNIYLNEDFTRNADTSEGPKSFLSRLCSQLCRKFHKSTIV